MGQPFAERFGTVVNAEFKIADELRHLRFESGESAFQFPNLLGCGACFEFEQHHMSQQALRGWGWGGSGFAGAEGGEQDKSAK